MLDLEGVKNTIPHREPFLFVDKVIEMDVGKRAVGIKKLTGEENFFRGHFPGKPIMPGVLMVEALAQVGAIAALSLEENKGKMVYFVGIDKVRFRKEVYPGDELKLEVEIIKTKGPIGIGKGTIYVDETKVAEGELMFAVK